MNKESISIRSKSIAEKLKSKPIKKYSFEQLAEISDYELNDIKDKNYFTSLCNFDIAYANRKNATK